MRVTVSPVVVFVVPLIASATGKMLHAISANIKSEGVGLFVWDSHIVISRFGG